MIHTIELKYDKNRNNKYFVNGEYVGENWIDAMRKTVSLLNADDIIKTVCDSNYINDDEFSAHDFAFAFFYQICVDSYTINNKDVFSYITQIASLESDT